MDRHEISQQLLLASTAGRPEPEAEMERLTESWRADGVGSEAAAPIIEFIEEHPDLYLGSPGPLVHFVESFGREAYAPLLVESVARRPTFTTAWMINRLLNQASGERDREVYLGALKAGASRPAVDQYTKDRVLDFLSDQSKRRIGAR